MVRETIEQKLEQAFTPSFLFVRDDSHQHAGHAGARPEGQTHFYVEIASAILNQKSRVAAQRAVYQTLDEELKGPVHALELKIVRD